MNARPVRVCFLIDALSRAGTESQLLALIRTLDRGRVQPSLVLLDGDNALSQELEPTNCPVLRLGVKKLASRSAIRAVGELRRFWRETQPDVLQAYFMDSAYFGVPLAANYGIRRIVRVRNNLGYWLTRKHRMLNRLLSPMVSITLTNTDAGHAALRKEGVPSKRIMVLENGVDLDRFADFPTPFTRPIVRVGCVANLRAVKNIDGLMRAAQIVLTRFPDARFEVAGEGEQRRELEQIHTELNLGERFLLRGSVTDVPAFLGSLDLAVLPSHSEGMSNALLEYMAAGRAIVATNVGANPKLITDGEQGLLVPPGDVSALADAMMRLLSDHELSQRFGRAARQRVVAEYSREAMCRRFEEFYERLAFGTFSRG